MAVELNHCRPSDRRPATRPSLKFVPSCTILCSIVGPTQRHIGTSQSRSEAPASIEIEVEKLLIVIQFAAVEHPPSVREGE